MKQVIEWCNCCQKEHLKLVDSQNETVASEKCTCHYWIDGRITGPCKKHDGIDSNPKLSVERIEEIRDIFKITAEEYEHTKFPDKFEWATQINHRLDNFAEAIMKEINQCG